MKSNHCVGLQYLKLGKEGVEVHFGERRDGLDGGNNEDVKKKKTSLAQTNKAREIDLTQFGTATIMSARGCTSASARLQFGNDEEHHSNRTARHPSAKIEKTPH